MNIMYWTQRPDKIVRFTVVYDLPAYCDLNYLNYYLELAGLAPFELAAVAQLELSAVARLELAAVARFQLAAVVELFLKSKEIILFLPANWQNKRMA